VEKLAVVPEIAPVPIDVPPSAKVTVPVAPAVTVAVKVTELPNPAGFGDATTDIVEDARVAVSATVMD
jgi:hypothetical protein